MIQISIPNYLKQVQVSKRRNKKYFENSSPDKYPKKYQNNKRYGFKDGRLYDFVSFEYVVKNERLLEKPRFAAVNGNTILRMHKDVLWGKVMPALDAMFEESLQKHSKSSLLRIPFPWKISMEFRTHYGFADWDIDNPWIYEKCFHDTLKRFMGFDDSILKITNGGEKKFRPVRSWEPRELIITIETDITFRMPVADKAILIEEVVGGKSGDMSYDYDAGVAKIFVGKKKLYGKAKEAIRKVMFKCLNDLVPAEVPDDLYKKYKKFFDEYKEYNVALIITR